MSQDDPIISLLDQIPFCSADFQDLLPGIFSMKDLISKIENNELKLLRPSISDNIEEKADLSKSVYYNISDSLIIDYPTCYITLGQRLPPGSSIATLIQSFKLTHLLID